MRKSFSFKIDSIGEDCKDYWSHIRNLAFTPDKDGLYHESTVSTFGTTRLVPHPFGKHYLDSIKVVDDYFNFSIFVPDEENSNPNDFLNDVNEYNVCLEMKMFDRDENLHEIIVHVEEK